MRTSLFIAAALLACLSAAASEVIAIKQAGEWVMLPAYLDVPGETLEGFASRYTQNPNGHWRNEAISETQYWRAWQPIGDIPADVRAACEAAGLLEPLEPPPEPKVFEVQVPAVNVSWPQPVIFAMDIEGNPWVLNPENYQFSNTNVEAVGVEPVDETTVNVWIQRAVSATTTTMTVAAPVEPEELEAAEDDN